MRSNLDPFTKYTDNQIWDALEQVYKYIEDNNLGQPIAILNNNYESNLV